MGDMQMLRERIQATGVSIVALARFCGISRETFYNRLAEESEFKASEIHILTRALHLTHAERDHIFFNPKREFNSRGEEGAGGAEGQDRKNLVGDSFR